MRIEFHFHADQSLPKLPASHTSLGGTPQIYRFLQGVSKTQVQILR